MQLKISTEEQDRKEFTQQVIDRYLYCGEDYRKAVEELNKKFPLPEKLKIKHNPQYQHEAA
jgi:hypothetical protein